MVRQLRNDSAASTHIAGPYDDSIRILSELPQPRSVRLSFRGKSMLLAIPAGPLAVAALAATKEHYHPTGFPIRAGLETLTVVMIVLGVVMLLIYLRQKRLVSQGELAIGRVTGPAVSSRIGTYLRYEFETHQGERLSDIAWYGFPILSAGMRLPVFYDRDNPDKKVALCGSFYKIVPTGGSRQAAV